MIPVRKAVLINCYNYESYVEEAIRSVAAQTVRPDELIVVDDGSTDNSVVVAEKVIKEIGFGRVVTQKNGGQLSAFQRGIAEARADWILFLDADDRFRENHLEVLSSYISGNPSVSFFFTGVKEFGDGQAKAYHFPGPDGLLGSFGLLAFANVRCGDGCVGGVTSSMCVKKSVLNSIFPFNRTLLEDWKIRADSVLWLATSLAGCLKYKIPEVTVEYRVHASNGFAGRKQDKASGCLYALRTERILGDLSRKIPYPPNVLRNLGVEYISHPQRHPLIRDSYWRASCIVKVGLLSRIRIWYQLISADLGR